MKRIMGKLCLLAIGIVIGGGVMYFWLPDSGLLDASSDEPAVEQSAAKKPLYWVAPMDPNYRRDKPGKSPMGMDLIPVYKEDSAGSEPGTVKINPDVVNNLGVRTARAELGTLQPVIETVGYIGYDEDRLVHVHPRVEGWIEKLYVKASGDPVAKGEPLYDIYSPALVNAQEELVLALDRNKSRLISAAENRLLSLRVPQEVINHLRKTKEVLQAITFFAPQSGVVDNLQIRQGFFVKPGSTIMSIGTLDPVWVEAEVFERQAAEVAVGLPVTMTLDYLPEKQWQGQVDYIYPTLNAKTRTIRIRLRFANNEKLLKPNMFAQVAINLQHDEKRLLVPREAVIRFGRTNRVVLAQGEGHFKSVTVKVGAYDEHYAEILSGIKEGEKVVTSAQFLIDSESSKTADFKRMDHSFVEPPSSVWVEATINSVMMDRRMVNATHRAIEQWNWPVMTMDFTVGKDVELDKLRGEQQVHLEISRIGDNMYQITRVHRPGAEKVDSLNEISLEDMSLDDMDLNSESQENKE